MVSTPTRPRTKTCIVVVRSSRLAVVVAVVVVVVVLVVVVVVVVVVAVVVVAVVSSGGSNSFVEHLQASIRLTDVLDSVKARRPSHTPIGGWGGVPPIRNISIDLLVHNCT